MRNEGERRFGLEGVGLVNKHFGYCKVTDQAGARVKVRFIGANREAHYGVKALERDFAWRPLPVGIKCDAGDRGLCTIVQAPFRPTDANGAHEYLVVFDGEGAETARLSERDLWPIPGSLVTFAYVTGWRINSEVLPLQWRQVDLKAGEVRLDPGTTKNMEGRVFYLTVELKKLLADQRKAANRVQRQKGMIVQHVFFHDGTTKAGDVAFLAGHAISSSGFYHAWCRARINAGCPGSIPHDFRRTAIRNMVRAGVPERVAMKLSGHKTRSVFDRYNIVSDGDLRDAARRLEDHPKTGTPVTRSKS